MPYPAPLLSLLIALGPAYLYFVGIRSFQAYYSEFGIGERAISPDLPDVIAHQAVPFLTFVVAVATWPILSRVLERFLGLHGVQGDLARIKRRLTEEGHISEALERELEPEIAAIESRVDRASPRVKWLAGLSGLLFVISLVIVFVEPAGPSARSWALDTGFITSLWMIAVFGAELTGHLRKGLSLDRWVSGLPSSGVALLVGAVMFLAFIYPPGSMSIARSNASGLRTIDGEDLRRVEIVGENAGALETSIVSVIDGDSGLLFAVDDTGEVSVIDLRETPVRPVDD